MTREIMERETISFARFMELALYCPDCGYYEKEGDTIGRRGDFFTSVSVGNLFGELLAFQFAQWLEELRAANGEVRIIEAGAHQGQLAKDILSWLRAHRSELFRGLEYVVVEPSARRRRSQEETLREFAGRVRWAATLSEAKQISRTAAGVVFSNELLDAMPLHRFGWDAADRTWFEWGVAREAGGFVWRRRPVTEDGPRAPEMPAALAAILPEGFIVESSPAAETWWREAAAVMDRGKWLTIDYGLTAEEFFMPERTRGTLRAYHRHQLTNNLLANPGEQDLTAHVNFSVLQTAGEAAGLKTEAFMTQEKFLTQIAAHIGRASADFGPWTSARARQFQTLTHPEHLGRRFRVLIQSRGFTATSG